MTHNWTELVDLLVALISGIIIGAAWATMVKDRETEGVRKILGSRLATVSRTTRRG